MLSRLPRPQRLFFFFFFFFAGFLDPGDDRLQGGRLLCLCLPPGTGITGLLGDARLRVALTQSVVCSVLYKYPSVWCLLGLRPRTLPWQRVTAEPADFKLLMS